MLHSVRYTWMIIVLVMLIPFSSMAQSMPLKGEVKPPEHSIAKAAIFSAVLPGLGQAYNKKYWKIPIIYAGFGVLTYFIINNNNEYNKFREAYVYVANGDTIPINNPYVDKYNQQQLREAMDYYRRNRDLSYIITGLWYTLNILEAYVDAHFFDYDISEDLSMKISPTSTGLPFANSRPVPGLRVSLKF